MKRFLTSFLIFVLSSLFILNSVTYAKKYSLDDISIRAEVLPDGSLLINEARTYTFDGRFSWADYSLPLNRIGGVSDFELLENGIPYTRSDSRQPGTYQFKLSPSSMYVKWHYNARNESRTFVLKYRVENAVTVYQDIAEFYYKFVGEKSPVPAGYVDVRLSLPHAANTDSVNAWAHGPLHGELEFVDGLIHLWSSPLPAGQFWEVRALFPKQWVNEATKTRSIYAKQQILKEEAQWAEEANRKRLAARRQEQQREKNKKKAMNWSLMLGLGGLVLWFWLYQRYGRGYRVMGASKYSSTLPDDMTPAIANYVQNMGQLSAGALVATLFDLARKDFLELKELKEQKSVFFFNWTRTDYQLKLNRSKYDSDKSELLEYEREALRFLFDELTGYHDEISFRMLRRERSKVQKWFRSWKKLIAKQWGKKPFFEKSSIWASAVSMFAGLAIGVCGILIMKFVATIGFIAIITGLAIFALSFAIWRHPREIKKIMKELSAFKKYLKNYHFRNETARHHDGMRLEDLFIYGIALGVTAKVIEQLVAQSPDFQQRYFTWYHPYAAYSSSKDFAHAVSSMVSATSSTMSSSTGTGGGASGGGGGGGGGASGGAG